jgi:hypothetical protein
MTYIGSVSDFGLIVGTYVDANGNAHGFVLSDGRYTTIDDPFAITGGTTAYSSNNLGTVVGYYVASDGSTNGFEATPSH